ncbi:MFS transporter [Actinospica durhamensis]|uniref:MFS transporter n=1 Tax=Actinospica durhamensis TaxID=1508375 RepID=A0A941IS64_9ACTN|nr:MFS transporter [Actinospica durhamensis]MBR7839595.1 MFS transporter [Actinospica durhamensis]
MGLLLLSGARAGRVDPHRLYLLGIQAPLAALVALAQTTATVYYVSSGHLNPLELVTLGTSVELSYFFMQLPTGVLADLISRRLCVVAGIVLVGAGLAEQGLTPRFGSLLVGQFLIGLGAALQEGALDAWIADELDLERMTPVYLRATQLGLAAGIIGSILSALLASVWLSLPLLVGGTAVMGIGLMLAFVMPERRMPARSRSRDVPTVESSVLLRTMWTGFTRQLKDARIAVVAMPGFLILLGMIFFAGLWSESFDRLWGDFLLTDIRLPHLFGLPPAAWFSAISIVVSLLGLVSTQSAKRWTDHPDGRTTGRVLLVVTSLICIGVVAMAAARNFAPAITAYLCVQALRPVSAPLVTGWIVARVDPAVRATVLSARDMFDSAGQIVGGPFIGWIGIISTIRTALYAGAIALLPAIALLTSATTKMRPHTMPASTPDQTPALTEP